MHYSLISQLILELLFITVITIIAEEKEITSNSNYTLTPLQMNIEWVLQGGNMSFQGFFVEFLGNYYYIYIVIITNIILIL